ncbi:hypothetical protein VNI00_002991 [Paramarasmius palmivorus]|uniref:Uncharacterized protein n=1 Tax=Paramarasmius palmivorus TaxID=297713 RepID=A0AAW0DXE3_9AGAR
MQRRLEDQVDHLMEQCERHMASSRAHAEGEMDALHEVERLKRRLKQEMDARKRAEEATEEALEEIGRLNLAAAEHEAQSLSEEAEKVNLRWQLECEQEKNRRLNIMDPPVVMSSRTRQSTSNASPISRPSKRRMPSQDLSESDHERECSDSDCSCEDSDEDLSPQTPINIMDLHRVETHHE